MKGFLFSALFALVLGTSLAVPECPSDNGADILLANPADCNTFYQCINGNAYLQHCPAGLHWADFLKKCEFPATAKCEETEEQPSTSSNTQGPTTATTRGPKPDSCPEENGEEDVLLPNPDDCESFFKCLNGIPHLIPCPTGQEWSTDLDRCDFPEIAQCSTSGSSSSSNGSPSTTTSNNTPNECPEVDGPNDVLLPNPDDCGSFFKCLNGIPHLIACPSGQEWSTDLDRCDFPEIAQCSISGSSSSFNGSPSTTTPNNTPSECPDVDGPNDVLLPNPDDCGSFFKCLNGIPHLIACPSGQEWSTDLDRCDFPEIAQCSTSGSSSSSNGSPSTTTSNNTPNECPEVDGPNDVLLPNPDDCGSFFKCLNGIPHLIACPSGQEWSTDLDRCDFPEIAQCSISGSSSSFNGSPSTTTPNNTPSECPDVDGPNDVLLPNPDDCGSFFKCLNGIPHLIACPSGQEWSTDLDRCDFPEIAQCSTSGSSSSSNGSSSTTTPSNTPSECPEVDGPNDVLLPNPDDCGSFFKCLNGIPHLIACPSGQEWSTDLDRCDFPEIAQCSTSGSSSSSNGSPSTTTSNNTPSECPEVDGPNDVLLPNPDDCGSFFKCLNGIPHLIACPPGQEWSTELNRCDLPSIAQCSRGETHVTSPSKNENSCPAEDGPVDVLLPNPADCGSFYKCSGGNPVLHQCPPNLHWNNDAKFCDYQDNAQCVETESSVATQSTSVRLPSYSSSVPPPENVDQCPDEDGPNDVLLPNPDDCESFFKCLGGVPHLIPCPSGLHWNQASQQCDYPAEAQCERRRARAVSFSRDESSEENECPDFNDGYDIFFPNPEDCSTYYQCSNGEKILKQCGEGTLWHASMQRCDHADNAICAGDK